MLKFEKKFNEIDYLSNWKVSFERAVKILKEMLISICFKLWKISELCNMQLTPLITELITEFADQYVKQERKLKRFAKMANLIPRPK